MASTFSGFSEEDLKRIQFEHTKPTIAAQENTRNIKKIDKIGAKQKKLTTQYKVPLNTDNVDDSMEEVSFDKCKLSLKSTPDLLNNNNSSEPEFKINEQETDINTNIILETSNFNKNEIESEEKEKELFDNDVNINPPKQLILDSDLQDVKDNINYKENELAAHKAKLEDLQLRQKLMEEQNKKRKEMLAKALADRTKQTEEEVLKLEKIKKELQVLDGQFSQDVSVLRKKIDQACHSYADAEKTYLKIEKDFLQAKMNLQKEKEKKELLTEHLCALITHNETRKAKKLETLMLQLAYDTKYQESLGTEERGVEHRTKCEIELIDTDVDEQRVIVDGVDERTGKIVAL